MRRLVKPILGVVRLRVSERSRVPEEGARTYIALKRPLGLVDNPRICIVYRYICVRPH